MSKPIDKKLCTIDEAICLIKDEQYVVSGGFVGAAHPEVLTAALEKRFLETGTPKNLTLVCGAGQGDRGGSGANHFAHSGLLKRFIGGHCGLAPDLGKMILEGAIEAYNLPQGTLVQLLRDIAAGRPGVITHIGLNTFVDPAIGGGRLNDRTPPALIERVELGGKNWLWYKAFPVHIGLIRGTAADPFGNIVMNKEAIFGEMLPISQAVHNCGGIVIAQVGELLKEPADPHLVRVPGILVDKIVLAEPHQHKQTFTKHYHPAYCCSKPADKTGVEDWETLPMNAARIIASRACDEIPPGAIVNIGIGIPESIAKIAAERGLIDNFTMTVESGTVGGIPAGGLDFGAAIYPQAVVDQPAQFDFYDGRGLDFSALGAAQIDASGNVNVSKYGNKLSGVGGFINVSQTAKRLVFCGTFTADGIKIAVKNGKVCILSEGRIRKFIKSVEQICFSADYARRIDQEVLYVTERAVFKLAKDGIELIEVAPGIDVQKQILDMMDFKPIIRQIRPMAEYIFKPNEGNENG